MAPQGCMPSLWLYRRQHILLIYIAILWGSLAQALQMRLTNSAEPLEGCVELHSGNDWVPICGDGLGLVEANVICRHLGHGDARVGPFKIRASHRGRIRAAATLRCSEGLSSLQQCRTTWAGSQGCISGLVAWIRCAGEGQLTLPMLLGGARMRFACEQQAHRTIADVATLTAPSESYFAAAVNGDAGTDTDSTLSSLPRSDTSLVAAQKQRRKRLLQAGVRPLQPPLTQSPPPPQQSRPLPLQARPVGSIALPSSPRRPPFPRPPPSPKKPPQPPRLLPPLKPSRPSVIPPSWKPLSPPSSPPLQQGQPLSESQSPLQSAPLFPLPASPMPQQFDPYARPSQTPVGQQDPPPPPRQMDLAVPPVQPLPLQPFPSAAPRRQTPSWPQTVTPKSTPPPLPARQPVSPSPSAQPRKPPSPRRSPAPPRPNPLKPAPPPPDPRSKSGPVTCKVVLVGSENASVSTNLPQIQRADVQCTGGGAGANETAVNVTVGGRLLAFAAAWQGVVVSQRPGDEDFGLTFNNVPYLQLQNSVVRDLPYGRGALLQCANCSKVEFTNVTLTGLRPPANIPSGVILHGPIHASNVSYASLQEFHCSDVRDAYGWACVLLQFNTQYSTQDTYNITQTSSSFSRAPQLSLVNCTFSGNSVTRRGLHGAVHSFRVATHPVFRSVGLGMVVVAAFDATSDIPPPAISGGSEAVSTPKPSFVPSSLAVSLYGITATDNIGGYGAVLSVINLNLDSLVVSRCAFVSNIADASGGAISLGGPITTVRITDGTQFDGNTAVHVDGGALFLANGADTFIIEGKSFFQRNRAEAGTGGAIRSVYPVGSLSVASMSFFDDNLADADGGAIALGGLGALAMTGNATVSRNVARRGGAIWVGGATTTVSPGNITLDEGSNFTGNYAIETGGAVAANGGIGQISVLRGSSFARNQAGFGGGAVAVLTGDVGGILLANGSTIAQCRTLSGDGGAVLVLTGSLAHLELRSASTINDNIADAGSGGAVAVYGNLRELKITFNSSIYNNNASADGGGIWASGGIWVLRIYAASSAANNTAAGGSGGFLFAGDGGGPIDVQVDGSSWLLDNVAGLHGGVASLTASFGIIRLAGGSILSGNVATRGNGGVVCFTPWPFTGGRSERNLLVAFINVTLSDNHAGGSGGVLFLVPKSIPQTGAPASTTDPRVQELTADLWVVGFANATLERNSAGGAGGAVLAAAGPTSALRVNIVNCTMNGNLAGDSTATSATATVVVAAASPQLQLEWWRSGVGGAIAVAGLANDLGIWTSMDVEAVSKAAAVTVADWSVINGTDIFNTSDQYSTLEDVLAILQGLPLNPDRRTCYLAISDSSFSGDVAAASGGALYLSLCTALVDRSGFTGNTAGRSGGAVAAEAPVQIPNMGPTSGLEGRWWYVLQARNSAFQNNTAGTDGGAISTVTTGKVALYGCVLNGNNALGARGGGVASLPPVSHAAVLYGAALELESCSLTSNSAAMYGGGVFTGTMNAVRLAGSRFEGNSALLSGGGAAIVSTGVMAPSASGVIMDDGSQPLTFVDIEVIDTLMAGNRASFGDGGALYLSVHMTATLTRVTFLNNSAGGRGGALAAVTAVDPLGFLISSLTVGECGPVEDLDFFVELDAVDVFGLTQDT
ncbi:hypothetical protein VaNZ11_016092 [Volvox africanus]|uniref:SRCR domain-containing protein n=1 Tax=Volvox africanus TaxID=51714 RepID=A0ABQ5SN67_9CHLO|nr:hypothetical protein VaNZ11_016092 [Volvox africanus]